ncbi:hypothetical protein [Alloalcanivorax xenomutans]
MRVTNTINADVTVGGITLAPGESGDADIEKDHLFIRCGYLKVMGGRTAPQPSNPNGGDEKPFKAQHKGGGKWVIVGPDGQEVPGVSGNKDEIAEQVETLNEQADNEDE